MNIQPQELPSVLRFVRLNRGMSFRQVAQETGVSASTVNRVELGACETSKIDGDTFARLYLYCAKHTKHVQPTNDTLTEIAAVLAFDDTLTKKARQTLMTLMVTAYRHGRGQ